MPGLSVEEPEVVTSDAHILVVDDEAEVRDMLREYLVEHGFAVSTAESVSGGREVLAAAPSIWSCSTCACRARAGSPSPAK